MKKRITLLMCLFFAGTLRLSAQCGDMIQNPDFNATQNVPNGANPSIIFDAFNLGLVPNWYNFLVSPDIHLTGGQQGSPAPFHCARIASVATNSAGVVDGIGRSEAVAQNFSTPLMPGQSYNLSFQMSTLIPTAPINDLIVYLSDGTNTLVVFQATLGTGTPYQTIQSCITPTQNWTTLVFENRRNNGNGLSTSSILIDDVHVTPLDVIPSTDQPVICLGQSTNLEDIYCENVVPGVTYQWIDLSNGTTIGTTREIFVSPATPGVWNYRVIKTYPGVACTVQDDISITVNPNPTVNAGPDVSSCSGTPVTLTATSPDNVTYSWDNGTAGATNQVSSTTATHTVTVTDQNGCMASDAVNVSDLTITLDKNQTIGGQQVINAYTYQTVTYTIQICNNTSSAQAVPVTDQLPNTYVLASTPPGLTNNGGVLTGTVNVPANDCITLSYNGMYLVTGDEVPQCVAQPPNVVSITNPVCNTTLTDQTDLCISFGCPGHISSSALNYTLGVGQPVKMSYNQHRPHQNVSRIAFKIHYPDFLSILPDNNQPENYHPNLNNAHIEVYNPDGPSQAHYRSAEVIATFDPVTIGVVDLQRVFSFDFEVVGPTDGVSNAYNLFVESLSDQNPNNSDVTENGVSHEVLTQIGILEILNGPWANVPTSEFTYVVNPCSYEVTVYASEPGDLDRWEFNDPNMPYVPIWGGTTASWKYSAPGVYTINHVHINEFGNMSTLSKQITIEAINFDYPAGINITGNNQPIQDLNGDQKIFIAGPVTIAEGLNYQINNKTLYFADDRLVDPIDLGLTHSGIIVNKDATLKVSNSLLTSIPQCPALWQGIQVYGDDVTGPVKGNIGHPINNLRNGKLLLINSTIEDARIGVALYRINVPFGDTKNYGRGIIESDQSRFYNNRVSVAFKGKVFVENNSKITRTTFKCNHDLKDIVNYPNTGSSTFVMLENVKNVLLQANSYLGNLAYTPSQRATAIRSFDASYIVLGSLQGTNTSAFMFKDLTKGIDVFASGGTDKIVRIKDNRFFNTQQGITANGSSFDEISYNTFEVPAGSAGLHTWGLNMQNSLGFVATQNTFNAAVYSDYTYGVLARNTKLAAGNVYKNTFTGSFYSATQSEQVNDRLQIKCNTYSATNRYDWTVTSGILANQGSCGSVSSPAGNVFGPASINDESQIFKAPSVPGFVYSSHASIRPIAYSQGVTVTTCTNPYSASNSCPTLPTCNNCAAQLSVTYNNTPAGQEKDRLKSDLIRGYVKEGRTEDVIALLTESNQPEDVKLLIPTHLDRGECNQARALMNTLDRTTVEGDDFFKLYDILSSLCETGRGRSELTAAEKQQLREISERPTLVSTMAESVLLSLKGNSADRFAERMDLPMQTAMDMQEQDLTAREAKELIVVYPNPSSGEITIKAPKATSGSVMITDQLGRIHFEASVDQNQPQISTALKQGVYIVKFVDAEGNVETKQLFITD